MPPEPHKIRLLRWAEAHEKRGNLDHAIKGYVEAEAFEQAARVSLAMGRFVQAGHWLLHSIGYNPRRTLELDPAKRKIALKAAHYFVLGEELKQAVEILVNIGERERALELLRRSGQDPGAVAAVAEFSDAPMTFSGVTPAQRAERAVAAEQALAAQRSGDLATAARLFAQGDRQLEAALCYAAMGDMRKALAHVVRLRRDDPRYREACVLAVKAASALDELAFQLELFIGDFLATGPLAESEHDTFYALGTLCERNGLPVYAADCYRKLLNAKADYRDVGTRLAAMEGRHRGPAEAEPEARPDPMPEPAALPLLPRSTIHFAAASPVPAPPPPSSPVRLTPSSIAAPSEVSFTEGAVVNQRYQLTRLIGRGGMSLVFEARDLELDEPIAIKFFSSIWADDAAVARFKQEVSLSRRFNHRNIVRLYDLGSYGEYRYITMELLSGDSLRSLMSSGALEFWSTLDLIIQACNGLQCVHDEGVIHRDIKPENFFVTDEGALKVMDFGIAKRRTPGRAITMAGMMAGTPQYMAPEQISNFGAVTHLADLYSLGCIAYELFTGSLPFQHEDLTQLLVLHMNQAPEPPRARNPALPEDLEAVILRLLDKEPGNRFQSCRALAAALANIRMSQQTAD